MTNQYFEEDLETLFEFIVSKLGKPGRFLPAGKNVWYNAILKGTKTPRIWYGDIDPIAETKIIGEIDQYMRDNNFGELAAVVTAD